MRDWYTMAQVPFPEAFLSGGVVVGSDVNEVLSSKRRVVVVLTLLVDARGQVIHGEILDPCGRPPRMFADIRSVGSLLQTWIDEAPDGGTKPCDPDVEGGLPALRGGTRPPKGMT